MNRLPRKYQSAGIILIEALMAIVLFMALVTLVALYQSRIISWYYEGVDRLYAVSFARAYLEQYIKNPYIMPSHQIDGKFLLKSTSKVYPIWVNHSKKDTYLSLLTVMVEWPGYKQQHITLETTVIMQLRDHYVS